jgi:hypothetical protein
MLIESVKNYIMSGFSNVSDNIKANRLNTCKSCEHFNQSLHQCKLCGCFLQIKTSWATEKCPIDKWPQELIQSQQQLIPSGDCGCNKKNV